MRIATIVAALALLIPAAEGRGQEVGPRQEAVLQVRIFARNPDTGKESLSQPSLTTLVGRPCVFLFTGNRPERGKDGELILEDPKDLRVNLVVAEIDDDKLRLKVDITDGEGRQTEQKRSFRVDFGEPVRLHVKTFDGSLCELQVRVRRSADDTDDSEDSRGKAPYR